MGHSANSCGFTLRLAPPPPLKSCVRRHAPRPLPLISCVSPRPKAHKMGILFPRPTAAALPLADDPQDFGTPTAGCEWAKHSPVRIAEPCEIHRIERRKVRPISTTRPSTLPREGGELTDWHFELRRKCNRRPHTQTPPQRPPRYRGDTPEERFDRCVSGEGSRNPRACLCGWDAAGA